MPQPGEQIGPYTLIRVLGSGTFKVVWLAEKRTQLLTTQVAVGIIIDPNPDINVIREEAERWKHAGDHPNVLAVLDADIYDYQIVIVSKYAPGGDLLGWLKRHGGKSPSVKEAVSMVCGILSGLEHLHGLAPPIQHRDLKPANILLRGETPMLTDFGVSRMFNSTVHTRASGTPSYMPPEAFDEEGGTLQADIWAVGVILYQLLSGKLPYPQKDMMALYGAMKAKDPEPLADSIPQSVRAVVLKAMQKDPRKRYKTAKEMRLDLENALAPKASAPPQPVRTRTPVAPRVPAQQTVVTQAPVQRVAENASNPWSGVFGCIGLAAVLFVGNMVYTNITKHPISGENGSGASSSGSNGNASGSILPGSAGRVSEPINPDRGAQSRDYSFRNPRKTKTNPIDGAEMSLIPAGTFTMGSEETKSDNPEHKVTLRSSYYMYQKDVTVAQFRKYDDANGNKFDWNGNKPSWGWIDDHPMVRVSWDDAQGYCKWAGVRLPTEAEWEHAARGPNNSKFPWGDEFDGEKCANSVSPNSLKGTKPVGSFAPNGYGLYDMSGNVWNWCSDWYEKEYNVSNATDPQGAGSGSSRVLRGGSWGNGSSGYFRSSYRNDSDPTFRLVNFGFRCVSGP